MGDHAMLERLQEGEGIALEEFQAGHDPITRLVIERGGLFPFAQGARGGRDRAAAAATRRARPMTMAEKILARHVVGATAAAAA